MSLKLIRLLLAAFLVLELAVAFLGPDVAAAKQAIAEADARQATPSWEHDVDVGIHYAALINAALLVVLLLTSGLWARPFVSVPEADPLLRERPPLWQRLGLPVLMIIGFSTIYGTTSFASKSLWWDELWAMKQCVHGQWKADKKNPEELKFSPTTWKRCAFYYQKPTNHAPMSLAQKASLSVWRAATSAQPHEFSELAVRMPALVASGIAVLLLMRLCGTAQGAAIGGLLLLVHPWHLRYGVDARAYAFVVPLCLSAMLAARKIIFQRGRKPGPWVWLALNQAVWVWVYPYGALEVLAIFVVLAVFLWRGEDNLPDKFTALQRVVVAHVFAGMICIQAFLPNFMQARHWAGQEDQGHQLDARILKDTLSNVAFGMNWKGPPLGSPEGAGLTGLVDELGSEPVAYGALALMLGLSLLGIRWAVKNQPRTGWLIAAPLISGVGLACLATLANTYYYPRFAIALLPVFVAGLSFTGQLFSVWTQTQRRIVLGVTVVFILLTNHQRGVLMARPYAGIQQAAQFVQQWPTTDKPPLVACFGLGREVVTVYYPRSVDALYPADLDKLRAQAKAEGRDLLILQGYTFFHRDKLPEGMKVLADQTQFEEVASFPGIEPDFLFRVLKAKL
jgi:hypothetical protein